MTLYSAIGEMIFLALLVAGGAFTVWLMTFVIDFLTFIVQNTFGACVWLYVKVRYVWFRK